MRTNSIKQIIAIMTVPLLMTDVFAQESTDSLTHYLEQAARNNPQINSDFMLYKAALEKIPQAGAYPDPELEIGLVLQTNGNTDGKTGCRLYSDANVSMVWNPKSGTWRSYRNGSHGL